MCATRAPPPTRARVYTPCKSQDHNSDPVEKNHGRLSMDFHERSTECRRKSFLSSRPGLHFPRNAAISLPSVALRDPFSFIHPAAFHPAYIVHTH